MMPEKESTTAKLKRKNFFMFIILTGFRLIFDFNCFSHAKVLINKSKYKLVHEKNRGWTTFILPTSTFISFYYCVTYNLSSQILSFLTNRLILMHCPNSYQMHFRDQFLRVCLRMNVSSYSLLSSTNRMPSNDKLLLEPH